MLFFEIYSATWWLLIIDNQEEQRKQVDELFKDWDRWDSPGAAIAIVQDGEIIYKRGYRIANLEYGIPITPTTGRVRNFLFDRVE